MKTEFFTRRISRSFLSPTTAICVDYQPSGMGRFCITVKLSMAKRSVRVLLNNENRIIDHDTLQENGVSVRSGLAINCLLEGGYLGGMKADAPLSLARGFALAYLDAIEVALNLEKCLVEGKTAQEMYELLGGYEDERQSREAIDLTNFTIKIQKLGAEQYLALGEIWESLDELKAYYLNKCFSATFSMEECSEDKKMAEAIMADFVSNAAIRKKLSLNSAELN
jgi:hypothetical protein